MSFLFLVRTNYNTGFELVWLTKTKVFFYETDSMFFIGEVNEYWYELLVSQNQMVSIVFSDVQLQHMVEG